jgi:hypothetical protein
MPTSPVTRTIVGRPAQLRQRRTSATRFSAFSRTRSAAAGGGDPSAIAARLATAKLTETGHAAHDLGSAFDTPHQHFAHLATEPDHTHEPERSDAPDGSGGQSGPGPHDHRAETVATGGHIHGHERAGLLAADGQKQMALDIRADRPCSTVGRDWPAAVPVQIIAAATGCSEPAAGFRGAVSCCSQPAHETPGRDTRR